MMEFDRSTFAIEPYFCLGNAFLTLLLVAGRNVDRTSFLGKVDCGFKAYAGSTAGRNGGKLLRRRESLGVGVYPVTIATLPVRSPSELRKFSSTMVNDQLDMSVNT